MKKFLERTLLLILMCLTFSSTFSQLTLIDSNPKRNTTGVPITQIIQLKFSELLDPASVAGSIRVMSTLRGNLTGSITSQADGLNFTPENNFYPGETIIVSVLSSLRSLVAQSTAAPTTVQFTIASGVSPAIPALFNDVKQYYDHTGVAYPTEAADMDGDGDLDLVFAATSKGLCWHENTPSGYQLRVANSTILSTIEEIIVADFDNDGDMDILVAAFYQGLTLYVNNGAMVFTTTQLTVNRRTLFAAIADFDLNGYADIVFGYNNPGEKTYVLYNQGNNIFTEVAISNNGIVQGETTDIDGDGDWDIVLHNYQTIRYLVNDNNTFTENQVANGNIYYILVVDLDRDQYPDIISAEKDALNIYVNDSHLNFTRKNIESGKTYYSMTAGDFDGDKDADLIVPDFLNFNMLVNDGANNFSGVAVQNTRSMVHPEPEHIGVADLDHDGDLDFFSAITNMQLQIYYNVGLPEAYPFSALAETYKPSNDDADWGDYDNDGDLDLVMASGVLYENQHGQLIEKTTTLPMLYLGSCDWGDLDHDGDLDILLTGVTTMDPDNYNPATYVYRNDAGVFTLLSSATIQLPRVYSGEAKWADFDNDGWLDIIYNANGFSGIYKSDESGNFSEAFTFQWMYQTGKIACGDMDADGDLDFAVSGWSGSEPPGAILKVYRNEGQWKFSECSGNFAGRIGGNLSWTDVDNDGDLDLLASGDIRLEGGHAYAAIDIYENRQTEFRSVYQSYFSGMYGTTSSGDFNNDGLPDVFATAKSISTFEPNLYLLLNESDTLRPADIYLPRVNSSIATGADYDNDNDLDIFIESTLLRNNSIVKNTPPTPPSGIQIDSVYNNTLYFHWPRGDDSETPSEGLSYEVYAGTQSRQQDIVNAHANTSTGFRKIPQSGSVKGVHTHIQNLKGGTYFLGVQSVDTSLQGSEFSAETEVFVVGIEGGAAACLGGQYTYWAQPGGSYTWQVIGGTILSGQGSDSVVVEWINVGKGFLRVTDAQQHKNTLIINVDKVPSLIISGDNSVCTGSVAYMLTGESIHSSVWSITEGNSLQNVTKQSATANWLSTGTFKLIAQVFPEHKGCSISDTLVVDVDQRPSPAINGPLYTCVNEIERYVSNAHEPEWYVQFGTLKVDSSEYIKIHWDMNVVEGLVWVEEMSRHAYCSSRDTLRVRLNPLPPKPYLTLWFDTLVYSSPSPRDFYKWYFNGVQILEGQYNAVIPTESGVITVQVFTSEGCASMSEDFNFYVLEDLQEVRIFPNPADQYIAFEWTSKNYNELEVFIYSTTNTLVKKFTLPKSSPTVAEHLDISDLIPGVYVLKLKENDKIYTAKFVKK